MKYKTTKRAVNAGYVTKICVSYCGLQHLLSYENPVAYTVRSEGWAADIYEFGNVAIVTGYAPFGNIRPGYDLCKKYDDEGRKVRYDYSIGWEKQKEKLRKLIDQFIEEVAK